jgi:hypothetical protein
MRQRLGAILVFGALFIGSAGQAQSKKCPLHEEGIYPWSANIPTIVNGDLWAWVYLDLDKGGHPLRCYIGETNISGNETKSDLCRGFVSGWQATPLMKDGVRVAGTTRRQVIIIGNHHKQLFDEARKTWFAQHRDDNPDCYDGTANN